MESFFSCAETKEMEQNNKIRGKINLDRNSFIFWESEYQLMSQSNSINTEGVPQQVSTQKEK